MERVHGQGNRKFQERTSSGNLKHLPQHFTITLRCRFLAVVSRRPRSGQGRPTAEKQSPLTGAPLPYTYTPGWAYLPLIQDHKAENRHWVTGAETVSFEGTEDRQGAHEL